jgi:hypothetical protein
MQRLIELWERFLEFLAEPSEEGDRQFIIRRLRKLDEAQAKANRT